MRNNEQLVFKTFSDCITVKGYNRGIICDLNRKLYKFIPNEMINFIEIATNKTRNDILSNYSEENHSVINDYLTFMEENDFAFFIPESLANNFPKLALDWDYPAKISNAIIDINNCNKYNLHRVLTQLEALGCKHIQIKSYTEIAITFFVDILEKLISSQYLSIEIITKFNPEDDEKKIFQFLEVNSRLRYLIFHSANENIVINQKQHVSMGNIVFTKQLIKSPADCQNHSLEYLNIAMEQFTESLSYHTYYNRKVSIDEEGNIKNCNSHDTFFGNVNNDKIEQIITLTEFQKLWYIRKDETEVCKDCEFRNICIDNRLPTKKTDGTYYFKLECNYNPYISKWKNEEGYKTLSECGIIVEENEFSIDKEKLNTINNELWG